MKSVLLVVWKVCFLTYVLLFGNFKNGLFAQDCNDSSYFSNHYQGINPESFIEAGITPQNEVIALGQETFTNQNFIAKFTARGSALWSYRYKTNYTLVSWMQFPWYTNLLLTKMAVAPDGSGYVSGVVTEHGETVANSENPPPHQVGVLQKIDKYGNVVWAKSIGAWYTNYSVGNILLLANGDLLIYLISYADNHVNRIMRLTNKGDIIWITALATNWKGVGDGVTHAMKEMPDGSIVVGDEVYRDVDEIIYRGWNPPLVFPAPLYYLNMFGLDKKGKVTWNSNYRYSADTTFIPKGFIPDIRHITALPDGGFSFLADMYIPNTGATVYTHQAVNILTDSVGNLRNIVGYTLPNNPVILINALETGNNGEQTLLVKDSINHQSIISQIDKDGRVQWTKGYANPYPQQSPDYFTLAGNGVDVLLSQDEPPYLQLLISNKSNSIPCLDFPVSLTGTSTTWQWELDQIAFSNIAIPVDFSLRELLITNVDYPLQMDIDCKNQNVCCTDIIDTTNIHKISLCRGSTYTLPDNTIVQDSGKYYVSYKTPKGCDSTVFYNITVYKNPNDLKLTPDTCLTGQDTLTLNATDSFYTYNWMNTTTTQPFYTVYKPGLYWVNVSNICGSKTDSVQVYDKCSLPVYMPNAFTPNNDGNNDVFRIPPHNINRLGRMLIYNRFGQLVFQTSDIAKGWDGTLHGEPQPTGTYVYYLIMHGLDGKEISVKGTVTLIR